MMEPVPFAARYAPFARAFDAAAPTYDADYGHTNAIMRAFRVQSLRVLHRVLPRGGAVLELGCGTGVEAVMLAGAAEGRFIVATDLSQEMLKQAEQHARSEGVSNVMFLHMAAGDVRQLTQRFPHAPGSASPFFAGAYSSFGPLNCEPDVRPVMAGLAALLPPGAPFVVSVMGRFCLWELAWHLAHGDARRALRRLRPNPLSQEQGTGNREQGLAVSPVFPVPCSLTPERAGPGGLGLAHLPVTYLTPRALAAAGAPWFAVEWQEGMGVALPPPALALWLARRPRLFRLLMAVEERLRGVPAAAWLGDHILMVLRRTAVEAP